MKPFIDIAALLAAIIAVIYLVSSKSNETVPAPLKPALPQGSCCEAPADPCPPSSCANKEDQCCETEKVQ